MKMFLKIIKLINNQKYQLKAIIYLQCYMKKRSIVMLHSHVFTFANRRAWYPRAVTTPGTSDSRVRERGRQVTM